MGPRLSSMPSASPAKIVRASVQYVPVVYCTILIAAMPIHTCHMHRCISDVPPRQQLVAQRMPTAGKGVDAPYTGLAPRSSVLQPIYRPGPAEPLRRAPCTYPAERSIVGSPDLARKYDGGR